MGECNGNFNARSKSLIGWIFNKIIIHIIIKFLLKKHLYLSENIYGWQLMHCDYGAHENTIIQRMEDASDCKEWMPERRVYAFYPSRNCQATVRSFVQAYISVTSMPSVNLTCLSLYQTVLVHFYIFNYNNLLF